MALPPSVVLYLQVSAGKKLKAFVHSTQDSTYFGKTSLFCRLQTTSVTRLGKILPLWQNFECLW